VVSHWMIPIEGKGLYHFGVSGAPTFHPFVGMGVGVGLIHYSYGGRSSSSTDFLWLPQIGAAIGASGEFFVNVKLGVVGSAFVLAPTVGWYF
jgi:hypothetical protein